MPISSVFNITYQQYFKWGDGDFRRVALQNIEIGACFMLATTYAYQLSFTLYVRWSPAWQSRYDIGHSYAAENRHIIWWYCLVSAWNATHCRHQRQESFARLNLSKLWLMIFLFALPQVLAHSSCCRRAHSTSATAWMPSLSMSWKLNIGWQEPAHTGIIFVWALGLVAFASFDIAPDIDGIAASLK